MRETLVGMNSILKMDVRRLGSACLMAIVSGVVLVMFCLGWPVCAQERAIGNVLDIEGNWYLDRRSGLALTKGAELPAGGVVRIAGPSRFAFIILRYNGSNQVVTRRCRNPGECDQPLLLPRITQGRTSVFDFIVAKAMEVIRRDPVSSSVNAGRSSDGVLREALVQLKDGQIDLAPVLAAMNKGTYYLRVEPRTVKGRNSKSEPPRPIRVDWNSNAATTDQSVNFQPGLYALALLERRGEAYTPTLTTAWLLAANAEQYARLTPQFREATQLTETWKSDVSEATARGFIRAFLIHLESQLQPTR